LGKKAAPAPKSTDATPCQPLKAKSGTRVAIRPVFPPPISSPALVMSLVSAFQPVSLSGHTHGSLKSAAPSYSSKLYFCCLPHKGALPLKPTRGPILMRLVSSARPATQTDVRRPRVRHTLDARKRWSDSWQSFLKSNPSARSKT